ncbi:MAG: hypothetical protein JSR67_14220 [Proteobacteria bacterium]|nr:hypothetical protein [Pseudomonadota bacterium]
MTTKKASLRTASIGRAVHDNSHLLTSKESLDLRPALEALLGETVSFLLAAGLSSSAVIAQLRTVAKRLESGLGATRPQLVKQLRDEREQLVEIAGVVHDWTRDAAFTDSCADPVEITNAQLRRLVGRRFQQRRIPDAVKWMKENRIVRKTRRNTYALATGRQMVYSSKHRHRIGVERAAVLVSQYLGVALRNAFAANPHIRDIDRDARVYFLPEKYVPLWREVVRERAQAFLESIDNWLEDHARHARAGNVREVALHCYSYTGESRPMRMRISPRPRRRQGSAASQAGVAAHS